MFLFLCVFRLEGTQVMYFNSTIKRLFLEVNISNTPSTGQPAEDAHNTILSISIPPSLIYSGVETKVEQSSDHLKWNTMVTLLEQL